MSLDFIKMVSEIHSQRYLLQIQNLIAKKIPCGFFTGFSIPSNISDIVNNLKANGLNLTCICCIDANFDGGGVSTPFVTLEKLPNFENKPQKMLYFRQLEDTAFLDCFEKLQIDMFFLVNPNGTENIYNLYIQHLPELYKAYEMLADDESKKVFLASIRGRVTQQIQDYEFAPESQYFLEGFLPVEGDIAIDGGSFDGGTSRDFSMQGAKVYAFEMDAQNYKNCLSRAEKYNFTIENLGLSNQEGEEFYAQGGTGSSKGHGNLIAKFTDLDTYVIKKNLPRVDYIKLDIEGAELDMLNGAAKTISRWKPKMAVSAYHRLEDLWTLATYIKSIRPDYKFKFRHYRVDCTDYSLNDSQRKILKRFGLSYLIPTIWEMVLYCK